MVWRWCRYHAPLDGRCPPRRGRPKGEEAEPLSSLRSDCLARDGLRPLYYLCWAVDSARCRRVGYSLGLRSSSAPLKRAWSGLGDKLVVATVLASAFPHLAVKVPKPPAR